MQLHLHQDLCDVLEKELRTIQKCETIPKIRQKRDEGGSTKSTDPSTSTEHITTPSTTSPATSTTPRVTTKNPNNAPDSYNSPLFILLFIQAVFLLQKCI